MFLMHTRPTACWPTRATTRVAPTEARQDSSPPPHPSFPRKRESTAAHPRHSHAGGNPRPPTPVIPTHAGIHGCLPTVIPTHAGIHGRLPPSFPRRRESTAAYPRHSRAGGNPRPPTHRHSRAGGNPRLPPRWTGTRPSMPAHAIRPPASATGPWIPASAGMTDDGAGMTDDGAGMTNDAGIHGCPYEGRGNDE